MAVAWGLIRRGEMQVMAKGMTKGRNFNDVYMVTAQGTWGTTDKTMIAGLRELYDAEIAHVVQAINDNLNKVANFGVPESDPEGLYELYTAFVGYDGDNAYSTPVSIFYAKVVEAVSNTVIEHEFCKSEIKTCAVRLVESQNPKYTHPMSDFVKNADVGYSAVFGDEAAGLGLPPKPSKAAIEAFIHAVNIYVIHHQYGWETLNLAKFMEGEDSTALNLAKFMEGEDSTALAAMERYQQLKDAGGVRVLEYELLKEEFPKFEKDFAPSEILETFSNDLGSPGVYGGFVDGKPVKSTKGWSDLSRYFEFNAISLVVAFDDAAALKGRKEASKMLENQVEEENEVSAGTFPPGFFLP